MIKNKTMYKIGIVTIHNSPNYGACLQSFALFYFLKKNGYDCEIIDIARPTHSDYIASKKYKILTKNKKHKFSKNLFRKLREIYNPKNKELIPLQFESELSNRKEKFNNFNSQIQLSKRYSNLDDLYDHPPLYDIYITGSDQVWNPGNKYPVEPYFLTFVPLGANKISYAHSLGIISLPKFIIKKYKNWLSSYDYLSIREIEGNDLLTKITHSNIEVVLDPIFLIEIEYWKSISPIFKQKNKYILCFCLGKNKKLISYANKISKELNFDLIILSGCIQDIKSTEYKFIYNAGPEEFIGWIKHAEIVLTDSFHASAFSLLLSKNFYSFLLPNKRGSRITNLLNLFSLSEHILNSNLNQTGKELQKHSINRYDLDIKIIEEQNKSRKYLLDAINS